jgi:hypothetical protein
MRIALLAEYAVELRVEEPATFPRVRPTRASLCRGGRGIQVSQGRVWHTSLWWAFFDIRGGKAETGSRMTRDRFDRPFAFALTTLRGSAPRVNHGRTFVGRQIHRRIV